MKALVLVAALTCASTLAAAQNAAVEPTARAETEHAASRRQRSPQHPLPTAVPRQSVPPQEAYASFPPEGAVAKSAVVKSSAPSGCDLRLAKIATFRPIPVLTGAGECGAPDAVLLEGVILSDQTNVAVAPPATLRCSMAEEVSLWVRDDVAPSVLKLGGPLRGLDNFDSYECRTRNRVHGALLSEHGRANALDVRGFRLANGATIGLTDVKVDKDWREGVRRTACARFHTVLGPGSDGYHEAHIHLDLAERRNDYKLCEWDVRVPVAPAKLAAAHSAGTVPLPRPRPMR